jgi:hypothetical protein
MNDIRLDASSVEEDLSPTVRIPAVRPSEEDRTPTVRIPVVKPQKRKQPAKLWKHLQLREIILLLLPIGAFILWFVSVQGIDPSTMNDYGLVSIMRPATIIALGLMSISFCLTLQNTRLRKPLLLLHIALLVFMLYGVTSLIETEPRFGTVYTHIGYTEYIIRHGSVDPGLETYFSWPTFFILGAFFTKAAGFSSAMSFVAWAPVFLNLIYFGPLFLILQSLTNNQRLPWLGVWLFYLANWIGQDYYSPQGMNIFLYMVILAILLKWFKTPVLQFPGNGHDQAVGVEVKGEYDGQGERRLSLWKKLRRWLTVSDTIIAPATTWQKVGLLVIMFGVFAFDVSSHPLTPFFVLAAVIALAVFRRISPLWLPVPMVILTAFWLFVMGHSFLVGHSSMVFDGFGLFGGTLAMNVSDHVVGTPGHIFVAKMDEVATALLWGLAFIGALRRLRRGYRDVTPILLAIVPFPLIVAQDYGGEMLLRIYLACLPFMVFFVASLFFEPELRFPTRTFNAVLTALTLVVQTLFPFVVFLILRPIYDVASRIWKRVSRFSGLWITTGILLLLLVFQGLFLFTRYGNELYYYVSPAEVNAMNYLYNVAPHGSILMRSWDEGPWQFQDDEYYDYHSLDDDDDLTPDIATNNYMGLVQYVKQHHPPAAYMVFLRSSQDSFAATSGLPTNRLKQIEQELLSSGNAKLIYKNQDAQIIQFVYQ